ncbi:hypothetical protein KXD40_009605 [Peronospora effusa]|uniref:Uncharacterized protein n=1 Tax=Peronospora effusa TaxID=542832 RepID=A0A3M6VGA3_9STRA|nr:hypothetical protein DD238_003842 [Peronospora effusa]RQM14317.1 hypothetical protein DD237_003689 [Peronospora effusa]UIZ23786.1 hypothetical protein KXD40_009605 [Peronospora effusa]
MANGHGIVRVVVAAVHNLKIERQEGDLGTEVAELPCLFNMMGQVTWKSKEHRVVFAGVGEKCRQGHIGTLDILTKHWIRGID